MHTGRRTSPRQFRARVFASPSSPFLKAPQSRRQVATRCFARYFSR
jgi:hypothetical protein